MSNIAIRVEELGKMYRIGGLQEKYSTLRDTITNTLTAPFSKVRGLLRGESASGLKEEIWALKDVSFEVKHSEVVGIIGRNGAGKSTLLKILSRITEPTTGFADIYGRVGALLEVGTGFHPELTGRENIYLNGAILGMSRNDINHKFEEIVDFAGVEQFVDTPVKHYSSGMGLRLGFAVAAHLEPEILIVDEVLAVGDIEFQKKCLGKMSDVAGDGRTVLFVSHNLKALNAICSSGIVFDSGMIQYSGGITDSIRFYGNLGGSHDENYRVNKGIISWHGIFNRAQLDHLDADDDVCLDIALESRVALKERIFVDFALHNEKNECVIHSKNSFVGDGFRISQGSTRLRYRIQEPHLALGNYFLTVYVHTKDEVLLWIDNIDACRIAAKASLGISNIYNELRSSTLPSFMITEID